MSQTPVRYLNVVINMADTVPVSLSLHIDILINFKSVHVNIVINFK